MAGFVKDGGVSLPQPPGSKAPPLGIGGDPSGRGTAAAAAEFDMPPEPRALGPDLDDYATFPAGQLSDKAHR